MPEKQALEKRGAYFFKGPEKCAHTLWKKVPGYIRLSFAAAFISGLMVHFYALSRKLPNHDDIGQLFGTDYGAASGRWLLPLLSKLDGNLSTPWLIGLISLFMLALSCCFAVSVLGIRRPLGCVMAAFAMVSFPSVTSTFAYMFSADMYFLSLALSCFAAYAAVRLRFGHIYGGLALVLSMAIYQSYFGVAAFLLVGELGLGLLDGEFTFSQALKKGTKHAAMLFAAMLIYIITVKLSTGETGLVDYMGISDMGTLSLERLPELFENAYFAYFDFFIEDVFSVHARLMKYAFPICGLFCAAFAVILLKKAGRGKAGTGLAVFLALIYPLAGNLIYIMVPDAPVHMLMMYGMICFLLVPLALAERFKGEEEKGWPRILGAAAAWIAVLTVAASAYGYSILANEAYLKMEISYEQSYAYSVNLMGAVQSAEGYEKNIPIVLVGRALEGIDEKPSPELDRIRLTGVADMNELINSYSYGYFLRRFVGAPNIVFDSHSEYSKAYGEKVEVKNMPDYPAKGSIKVIDNKIIVKLG